MVVKCDAQPCYWNKGGWCQKIEISLVNGKCQTPYDKNGNVREPSLWQNPQFEEEPKGEKEEC